MKFRVVLFAFFFASCASGKEKNYTGSTPADPIVRTFLGIPLSDSIDFIRWNLSLGDKQYRLQCNYGIGKPNTNGFYNGGKKIELSGDLSQKENYFTLHNSGKTLLIIGLNADLLHIAETNNHLLAGTAGWSYTLNNMGSPGSDEINLKGIQYPLKDSMTFQGRTPCGVPGILEPGKECYKLKWLLTLYSNTQKNEPATYMIRGTAWDHNSKTGNWKIIQGKDGSIIYELYDNNGDPFIHLLKPDENILLFTDMKGKLLVGNGDFSYTLNRKPPQTPLK